MDETDNLAITRLAGRFLLDQVTAVRFVFDLTDALIMTAITQANVDPITRDRALQLRYATYDAVPPDDLRRPISVNAVAHSLNIPFETVRRRVMKLALFGVLRIGRDGVFVPTAFVTTPRHKASAEACYARLEALQRELDRAGFGEPSPAGDRWSGPPPLRMTARIATEFNLRLIHLLMETVGDPVDAAIWIAVLCDAGPGGATPITNATLSRRLRLSHETVRRRVDALIAAGLLSKAAHGATIGAEVLALPAVQHVMSRCRQDLRRMMTVLAEFGLVQTWRSEVPASAAA